MLHINAQEDTKRRRQALTELAVAISSAEADLAVHEASASAAEVELATAQENTKQTRSELTKLAAELTTLAGAISVTEVELAVQAASTSAADDEYSRVGPIGPGEVSVPPNKTTGLIEMVTTSPKTGLNSSGII